MPVKREAKPKRRTDKIMHPHIHRNPQLRPHPIRPTHQHRIHIPRRLQIKHTSETTDLGIGAGTACGADVGLDGFDEGVAGVDGDAGLGVGEAVGGGGLGLGGGFEGSDREGRVVSGM